MDEAKQREEDRENNVKRYKRQDEQEKQREQNAKHDRHAGFIQYVPANPSYCLLFLHVQILMLTFPLVVT